MKTLTLLPVLAAIVCGAGSAHAAQEFSCTAPDSITGKALGPTTLAVTGFECAGAPAPANALGDKAVNQTALDRLAQAARRAPFVVVDFKAPPPAIKAGDMVTVKGHFSVVLDPDHQMNYVVVSDAQIAN